MTGSSKTGSSEANKYIDQIVYSDNPDIKHIREDDSDIDRLMRVILGSHMGEDIEVMLPDNVCYGSFPKKPKLVGIEKVKRDKYFIFDDTGYKLDVGAVSAIKVIGDSVPIYMRTYGGEDNVPVYHMDTRGVIFDKTTEV